MDVIPCCVSCLIAASSVRRHGSEVARRDPRQQPSRRAADAGCVSRPQRRGPPLDGPQPPFGFRCGLRAAPPRPAWHHARSEGRPALGRAGGPARSGGGARNAGQSGAARRAARQPRSTRREFIQVLLEVVRSAGSTALLSPHVVTDVEDACNRRAIMGARELGFQSFDSPKSEFVRRSGSAEN